MQSTPDIIEELVTIADFIRWGASEFQKADLYFGHGSDNALDEAFHLVMQILHLPWNTQDIYFSARLTRVEKQQIHNLINQRIETRKPLAYLLNQSWFCGLSFYVNESVLIPRSPIGELIKNKFSPWLKLNIQVDNILDLCCGSGCLGIAAAYEFDQAQIDLVDISSEALEVADINIDKHQLWDRVQTIESDLFSSLENQQKKYQIIISNPPYVDYHDLETMPDEFGFEPKLALEAGEDGLYFAKKILNQAIDYLVDDGLLVMEVGNSYAALQQAYNSIPFEWVDFKYGGHGVLVISAKDYKKYFAEIIKIK